MDIHQLLDIHTHQTGRPEALLSLSPTEAMAGCPTPYSLSLHPWWLTSDEVAQRLMEEFRLAVSQLASDPLLLAIGECGLDNKCGIPLALQKEVFRLVLSTARSLHLPVIIHCVGHWAEMMQCCREAGLLTPDCPPLIVHGFRKGPQLARQLLEAGFHISLGEKFNPEVAKIVPSDRLWFETDESALDIQEIRQTILEKRKG